MLSGCKLEVNTVDPQSSINVTQSKIDSFFLNEYEIAGIPDSVFKINNAWSEYIWRYDLTDDAKIQKKRTGGCQLNMTIAEFKSRNFADRDYIITWEMASEGSFFGKGNGVYSLMFNSESVPDTIEVNVFKTANQIRRKAFSFFIHKK
jgi:hypothetical protein